MGKNWWRSAVIYQVYVRSFADSNGDGYGDLPGVRDRLGYLADLGVDALWLTPFYASPMADGGYDVADYREVDPLFGKLADAEALIDDAHRHGLRVIVDLVPNHTSSAHPWFAEALAAAPDSPERARYVFREGKDGGPPNDWESLFGGPAWTRLPDGQWYLHLFDAAQPDLNWEHPDVHAEFESILRFWLDRGVDGIRIDVAHGLVKAAGLPDVLHTGQAGLLGSAALPYFDQDGVHDIYREWRKILDSYEGDRIAVAEAWVPNAQRLALYLRQDELHQAFNFHYANAEWSAEQFRTVIYDSLAAVADVGAPSTWVLSNHDIERHVTRYGGGETGLRRARAAALLTLALPGSAYVYQGEELGLAEVTDLPEEVLADPMWERSGHTERGRDGCRVPLPWSGKEPSFGFGGPAWLPQPSEWAALSVQAQTGDPDSTLSLYRNALRLRRDLPEGQPRWFDAGSDVLAFHRDPGFACTVNFGSSPVSLPRQGRILLSSIPEHELEQTDETVLLPPDSAVWWTGDSDA
ncbi:alpha-amylase [Prauserella marina]|uniref:Alpha-glucosidase n=1 Tax=Prauserella marina TaxID=530584 RepID=A0A222VXC6_9PSEU|nr:glycoside hydrolase family 13 protein [Prauserella marina]ASR38575.1 alpha-amylase [Prauserella marina]PWV81893.1 alpha-glucosidase [Prauserella marina]SDD14777.1 alpha-glucosidase [Prauserella marina]